MSDNTTPAPAPPEALWTPAELAAFLGYKTSTVTRMAALEPHRLPPRVAALTRHRWVPEVCRRWALEQTEGSKATSAPPPRTGRPRRVQAA